MAQKKKQKKRTKKGSPKAKARVRAKARAPKLGKKRFSPKKRRVTRTGDVLEVRGIETLPLSAVKPKARSARAAAGAGAGDYSGVSPVEGADSESPKELLEEGQTFEAEAVIGVQNAPNADQGEVKTREVPEDDVPAEYLDPDRP